MRKLLNITSAIKYDFDTGIKLAVIDNRIIIRIIIKSNAVKNEDSF